MRTIGVSPILLKMLGMIPDVFVLWEKTAFGNPVTKPQTLTHENNSQTTSNHNTTDWTESQRVCRLAVISEYDKGVVIQCYTFFLEEYCC